MCTVTALAVVLTGNIAGQLGSLIGVGSTAVTAWDIAKWPVMVLLMAVVLSLLYFAAPNLRQRRFRFITPGGLVAVLAWIVTSGLFAVYVANFHSYNKTYGALGGVVAFLVWMWLTNVVILFGAQVNAEAARHSPPQAPLPDCASSPDQQPHRHDSRRLTSVRETAQPHR